jgi:hypothetical protein
LLNDHSGDLVDVADGIGDLRKNYERLYPSSEQGTTYPEVLVLPTRPRPGPAIEKKRHAVARASGFQAKSITDAFLDRGPLRKLAEPTILPSGKRVPGRNPITRVNWQGCMRWCASPLSLPAEGLLRRHVYAPALDALGLTESHYTLASFRYDLSFLTTRRAGNWRCGTAAL